MPWTGRGSAGECSGVDPEEGLDSPPVTMAVGGLAETTILAWMFPPRGVANSCVVVCTVPLMLTFFSWLGYH